LTKEDLNHEFVSPINVVVILKTNLSTKKQAHVILFSTDLDLSYQKLYDYYTLRFQIEFNFRDAKQYWGLDDFMNIKPAAVTNAANLSFFMVNFSSVLLRQYRKNNPEFSVLDLKSHFRGHRYVAETIKLLPHIVPMSFGKNRMAFYWLRFSSKLPAWAWFIPLSTQFLPSN
jgi:putative transposase